MKAKAPADPGYPVTSVRLDPELVDRAITLARKNKRAKLPDDAFYKILGTALAEYLKKNG